MSLLGTGQNLSGTRAGTIDRGAKTFYRKKLGGDDFFNTEIQDFIFKKAIFEGQVTLCSLAFDKNTINTDGFHNCI